MPNDQKDSGSNPLDARLFSFSDVFLKKFLVYLHHCLIFFGKMDALQNGLGPNTLKLQWARTKK